MAAVTRHAHPSLPRDLIAVLSSVWSRVANTDCSAALAVTCAMGRATCGQKKCQLGLNLPKLLNLATSAAFFAEAPWPCKGDACASFYEPYGMTKR